MEIQEVGILPIGENKFEEIRAEKKRPREEQAANVTINNTNTNSRNSGNEQNLLIGKNQSENEAKQEKSVDYNEFAKKLGTLLDNQDLLFEFSKDKETEKMILKIIDKETEEIIRQFPPEVSLKIARIVANSIEGGVLTNAKV